MHEQEGTIQLFAAAKCPKMDICCMHHWVR